VGLQRVGGHYHTGQVEPIQQRGERGDLLGRAGDLALGQHLAGGVVHRRQQVRRAAIAAGWVGAAEGLAVHGHCPPPSGCGSTAVPVALPVGQPGADHPGQGVGVQPAERAADGGLGRDGEAAGGVLAGAERGPDRPGRVGRPFGDRGDRPRPGQHRGGRHGQDRQQRVARPRALLGSGIRAR